MIEYKTGNILTEDAEAIVNTVNCVGAMGRGIALQFKKAFPENFKAYAGACERKEVQAGRMFIFDMNGLTNPQFIINFPTKRHWRGKSRMEDIESGLKDLSSEIKKLGIQSIAIPPLGSGLGGLKWEEVKVRIERALADMDDVKIIIYEPNGAPNDNKMAHILDVPKMTPGRAALVKLMDRYIRGMLDPFVTLLEVHKFMYFMQEAGESLRLKYKKARYGPYAENLRHVLNALEGHFVSGYADGGDAPDKRLQIIPGAIEKATTFLEGHTETKKRFDQVEQLLEGFESTFGLELLASVHWVMKYEHADTLEKVVDNIHSWNERKRQFSQRQIGIAMDVLSQKGWLSHKL